MLAVVARCGGKVGAWHACVACSGGTEMMDGVVDATGSSSVVTKERERQLHVRKVGQHDVQRCGPTTSLNET